MDPVFRQSRMKEERPKGAAMKKAAIYAGLLAFLATPNLGLATTAAAQSTANSEAKTVTVTGKVSCARFGRGSVTPRKGMSVAQTIQYCVVFQHSQYTLVSGNRIYSLTGDPDLLAKMSGQTVTVAGTLSPERPDETAYAFMGTVAVTGIAPTKE
jgi:hypothetical protein